MAHLLLLPTFFVTTQTVVDQLTIKGEGGAVGLTQSVDGLRRWMAAGSEIVRMTAEFERSLETKISYLEARHLEQTSSKYTDNVCEACIKAGRGDGGDEKPILERNN